MGTSRAATQKHHHKRSAMWHLYVARLIARALLCAGAVACAVISPIQIEPSSMFLVSGHLHYIDIVFVSLVIDMISKLYPKARTALGARKQFGRYYKPAERFVQDCSSQGDLLSSNDSTCVSSLSLYRRCARRSRARKVVPVAIIWIVFNIVVAALLYSANILTPIVCVLWCLLYFLADMICVVAWCPFQVLFLHNRCCSTCPIFNWDALMAATPLLFAPSVFSTIILLVSLVVLVCWEAACFMYPERFDENANTALSCGRCADKLCVLRRPLRASR